MFFKKKENPPIPPRNPKERLDSLWDLFISGKLREIDEGIYYLYFYQCGVKCDGHCAWFHENGDDVFEIIEVLRTILPKNMYENLERAWHSYGTEEEDEACEVADRNFEYYEQKVTDILQAFADHLYGAL